MSGRGSWQSAPTESGMSSDRESTWAVLLGQTLFWRFDDASRSLATCRPGCNSNSIDDRTLSCLPSAVVMENMVLAPGCVPMLVALSITAGSWTRSIFYLLPPSGLGPQIHPHLKCLVPLVESLRWHLKSPPQDDASPIRPRLHPDIDIGYSLQSGDPGNPSIRHCTRDGPHGPQNPTESCSTRLLASFGALQWCVPPQTVSYQFHASFNIASGSWH